MKECLCCGKPLFDSEMTGGWHQKCIHAFFGTDTLPEIVIDQKTLELLAKSNLESGLTVTGVQKKLSLHLSKCEGKDRLTLVDCPAGYILKPQDEAYPFMPECEHLVMSMANALRIETVPHALIPCGGSLAYITKRIDRTADGKKLAMEDFCQLGGRLTADKYHGSYEQCGKILKQFSDKGGLDITELFRVVVFSFLTGNSDMHLKNFSLLEKVPNSGKYRLSPAYDLLPVNLILPQDSDETALSLNGKLRNLRRKDFLALAENFEITEAAANKMIQSLTKHRADCEKLLAASLLPDEMKARYAEILHNRFHVLTA